MHLKKLWLTTTALAALAGASQAQADGMYVSVFGGANFQPDQSQRVFQTSGVFIDFTADADTGFVLGGAVGAGLDNWVQGLRAEVEVSYRRQDVGGPMFSQWFTHTHTGTIDANQSTFAVMANIWYDIDMGWKIKPYVGGGAGWARSNLQLAVINENGTGTYTSSESDNSGFAWQLGLGFNYEVGPGVDVGLGYRYFDGPENSTTVRGNHGSANAVLDNENHSVMVNLTIETN
jgi:OmpA-OmpF porin, OOP family